MADVKFIRHFGTNLASLANRRKMFFFLYITSSFVWRDGKVLWFMQFFFSETKCRDEQMMRLVSDMR